MFSYIPYVIFNIKSWRKLNKMDDIFEFLPKYPDLTRFKNPILNAYDEPLNEALYKKKELYDLNLEKYENVPIKPGDLMNHQKYQAISMSSRTLLDQRLIVHEMGCLDPNTPVLLWSGETVPAKNVKAGDQLIGDDGYPRRVLSLVSGHSEMYCVNQLNGESYTVNGDHILSLKIFGHKSIEFDTIMGMWKLWWFDKEKMREKVLFNNDLRVLEQYAVNIPDDVLDITVRDYLKLDSDVRNLFRGYKCQQINWCKPPSFDYSRDRYVTDVSTRQQILDGITSKYGTSRDTEVIIVHFNQELINNTCFLARSLGLYCQILKAENTENYTLHISKRSLLTFIQVTPCGSGNYVGWKLDGNRRFLLGDCTVTHNSGKSCTAASIIEQIKSEKTMKGVIYLARGEALLENFKDELIFRCTDGRYIPDDYDKLTDLEQTHRKNKIISDFFTLNTFEKFSKKIGKITRDEDVTKKYSGYIIVIDEVHNLRIQDEATSEDEDGKKVGVKMYDQIHRFLHLIRDAKIIVMSGTPMKDNVDEIASVMNLILPMNKQLPTGKDFLDQFFDKKGGDLYLVKKSKKEELKTIFRGRVSYLKSMQSDVIKKFTGKKHGNLRHLLTEVDKMSEFQSDAYIKAWTKDSQEKRGVFTNCRQATLFVFPDGSYGTPGFNKYVKQVKKTATRGKKKFTSISYSLLPELKSALRGDTFEESIEKLSKFSSKYAASVKNLLENRKNGKLCFIYNELVQGSGLILFSIILEEIFGFSRASGNEQENSDKPRYAILTNITASSAKQLKTLVNRFNKPDNMHGKVISLIMGSRKIAEGFSLQNVQDEDIQTPWFNYSETAQAIARGTRLGSHKTLLKAGIKPLVTIHQRVSLPKKGTSIDLYMYEISEGKDVSIKGVERLISEAAIDCAAFYERNRVVGYDGQRECDYQECDYTCDNVPIEQIKNGIPAEQLDYSTWQLYYMQPSIDVLIEEITKLFQTNFLWNLSDLLEHFGEYNQFQVLTALRTMINESVRIRDKYGFPSFLREEYNVFFLVSNLSVIGRYGSEYYTEFPHTKQHVTFSQIIDPIYYASLKPLIKTLFETTNVEDIRKIMGRIPIDIQELVLESSISASVKKLSKNKEVRNNILEYYSGYHSEIDGTWVSTLTREYNDTLRCLQEDKWVDCDQSFNNKVKEIKTQEQQGLENNEYGYYGQYNKETGDFCIRDVSENIPEKKHQRTSGRRCVNWTGDRKLTLIDLVINKFDTPLPESEKGYLSKKTKGQLIEEFTSKASYRYLSKIYTKKDLEALSESEIRRIMFWGSRKMKEFCGYLKDQFDDKGLLINDKSCGKTGKTKV